MGFYFDEFEKDKKQHINLSEEAWCVIEQDIKNFYLDEKLESKSGFFNVILTNFYEEADASINIRCMNKIDELEKIFNNKGLKNIDYKTKSLFINSFIDDYKNKLIKKSKSYVKGHGEKFRINVNNVNLLRDDIDEEEAYEGNIGEYLKALYEEYALLPSFKREQIFFKPIIDEINKAISKRKKLKITIKEKFNPKDNTYLSKKFYVTPYKIVLDTLRSFNYLIGYAEEICSDDTNKEKKITSFRISRIDKIRACSSDAFLSKEKIENIERSIASKLPQFMLGDIIDVKIKFTEKGYENYNRILYLRPNNFTKVDKLTYVFHCTEMQAINYFLKFVRDIEVLEPAYLRDKFVKRYKDALSVYEK